MAPDQARLMQQHYEENKRLRAALAWVGEVYPGKNRESGGAIVHMTWEQFNGMREAIGLRPAPIPTRYSESVWIIKGRDIVLAHEQK